MTYRYLEVMMVMNRADYILCDGSSGAVKLYYYGSQKLNTKSDGIDVTGDSSCDSLDVDGQADITGQTTVHGQFDVGGEIGIMVQVIAISMLDVLILNQYYFIFEAHQVTLTMRVQNQFTRNGAVTLYHNNIKICNQ